MSRTILLPEEVDGLLMVETNVFPNVLRVPLDSYLEPFRRSDSAEVPYA
ncbi:MAG: hypothetical protein WCK70_06810 [Chloroflexales bacterium]|jgi:hypothetical protein